MQTSIQPEDWSRYALALRRLAAELVGPEQRDDLVQSTFAAALERPPRALSWTWLASVLRNRARDLARARARHGTPAALAELASGASDAAEIAQRLELQEDLTRELRALAEPYQSTLYLRYFEELTPAEIARRGNIPVKTVKTRLERGLALLRERLERRHGPGARALLALLRPLAGPASPPVSLTGTLAAGGLVLMAKKIAAVAAVLLVLVLSWRALRIHRGDTSEVRVPETVLATAPVPDDSPRALAASSATALREESARPPPSVERIVPTTGSLRVLVRWSDGTAAPDICVDVRALQPGTSDPGRGLTRVTSDGDGVALVRDLPPGKVSVETARGASMDTDVVTRVVADVTAGEEREVVLALADALEVEGRVLDERDAPVAGAEIWLTKGWWTDWLGMSPVGRSDADGRFHLRDVPATHSLGATAEGLAPSKLADLDLVDPRSSPAEVVLRFTDAGGALRGRVVDAQGDPVEGAFVCAGKAKRGQIPRPDGTSEEVWSPRLTVCDTDGRFRFEGLPPGVLPVEVKAPAAPVWSSTAEVRAGSTTELAVSLAAGAALEGVVSDASGAPVARAFVRAFAASLSPTFMAHGQYDDPSVIGSPVTLTDAEGRYRLENVWAGEVHAYASPPRGEDDEHSEFHAEAVLHPLAGETHEWNPVLEPGRTIRGRVLFSDREPMANVFVSAREPDSSVRRSLTTDDEGRFEFFNLPAGPFQVKVQILEPGAGPLLADGVFPDGAELELVADFPSEKTQPTARVRGRFADPDGRFAKPLAAMLEGGIGSTYPDWSEDGAFEFRAVEAGRYRLMGSVGPDYGYIGEELELTPGLELDLGTIVVPPGADLLLHLRRAPGLEGLRISGWLSPVRAKLDFGAGNEIALANLTRGHYMLRLYCPEQTVRLRREFELAGDMELDLDVLPCTPRRLEIEFSPETARGTLRILVTGEDGATIEDLTYSRAWNERSPYALDLPLPVGRYTARAETSEGFAASGELEVDAPGTSAEPLRLVLRGR